MNSNLVVNWVNILQAAPACVPLTGIGIGVICIWFGGWLRWDRWKYKIQDLTTIKSKWSVKQAQGLVFSSHLLWSGAKLWLLFSCPSSFPSCRFLAFWWLWGLLALCSSSCPSFSSCLHQVPSSPGLKYLEKRGKKEAAERERGFPEPTLHGSVTKSFEMKTYSSLHTEAKDTISSFMRLGSEIMQLFLHCITLQCFQGKSRLPITFQWLLEVHQYFLLTFPQVLWHLHGNHVSLFPLVVLY